MYDFTKTILNAIQKNPHAYFPHAFLNETNPSGQGSFSMNRKPNTEIGECSTTEGYYGIASGNFSHTEGHHTEAAGENSHAEGYSTLASGDTSHTEGCFAEATGNYSHAEGFSTTSSGSCSHAEGWSTTASGQNSSSGGKNTIAKGANSTARGLSTIANGSEQFVNGKFNISDTTSSFILGNGTSNTARSNAALITKTGDAWFAQDVYVGSTGGLTKDSGSKKLATEEYVDNKQLSSYILSAYPSSGESDVFTFEINNNGVKQTYPMKLMQFTRNTEDGNSKAINQIITQYRFEFLDESVTNTTLQNILNEFINAGYSKFIFLYETAQTCVSTTMSFTTDNLYPGLYINGGHIFIRLHPKRSEGAAEPV